MVQVDPSKGTVERTDWAANVVRRMYVAGITGRRLAEEAGITNTYLSATLHGRRGVAKTYERIEAALERLEHERKDESV